MVGESSIERKQAFKKGKKFKSALLDCFAQVKSSSLKTKVKCVRIYVRFLLMKIALLTMLLTLSATAFAQNCGEMQNGEVIRVDEGNKSLSSFRVQDQDGLGSCYANAASLLLQSALPDNPEVSYLHLATLYKTENLKKLRSEAARSGNYDIYVKEEKNSQKAINGAGGAMDWDLALDGGNTCGVITTVKDMQTDKKKPILCTRTNLNLEKILTSGDTEHKQFKTFLESSLYMNQFQKIFGDINERPGLFNKKRVLAAQEKYQDFKTSFQDLVQKKIKKIEEKDCNRINADNIDMLLGPLTQQALSYKFCFKPEFTSSNEYWCKVAKGLAYNAKVNADGSIEVKEIDPSWKKRLKAKIEQRKGRFSVENLSDDITDSFIENLIMPPSEKAIARKFMKDKIVGASSILSNSLKGLSEEFNEVVTSGFSPACIKRNTYGYFQTKEFEEDWRSNISLCSYAELMKQATNVIVKYKESGLDDLETAMDFLTTNAGNSYDQAMMALYASDCNDSTKVYIPQNVSCNTIQSSWKNKDEVDKMIIKKLKNNQPLTASLCAQILKKPKAQFKDNECGHHALGIVGIQCSEGKYKYLIQNSWGANYRATAESGIENIDGKGAYWFNEQNFFDSVYGVDYLN